MGRGRASGRAGGREFVEKSPSYCTIRSNAGKKYQEQEKNENINTKTEKEEKTRSPRVGMTRRVGEASRAVRVIVSCSAQRGKQP